MANGVGVSIACLGLARPKGDVDHLKRISFSFSRKGRLLFGPSPTLYPGPLHHSQIGKSPSMCTVCITGLLTASSLQVLPRRSQSSAASLQHLASENQHADAAMGSRQACRWGRPAPQLPVKLPVCTSGSQF